MRTWFQRIDRRIAAYLVVAALVVAAAIAWVFVPPAYAPIDRADTGRAGRTGDAVAGGLRVGIPGSCGAGLFLLGHRRGLFDKSTELIRSANGRRAFQKLLEGELDLAVVGDLPIAAAALERDDFAVLATVGRSKFDRWVLSRPGAGIKTPADLKGKRIATQRRTGSHYVLDRVLASASLAEDAVEIVDMSAPEMPRAIAGGRVDAFEVEHPFLPTAREHFGIELDELHEPNAYRLSFLVVARKSILEKSRASVEALLGQLARADDAWHADPEGATADVGQDLLAGAATTAKECTETAVGLSLDADIVTGLGRAVAWFSANGKARGKAPPAITAYVDPGPLRAVRPAAVTATF